ncbi:hypothetical protein AAG570_003447 [Ranatra chinensis]|uniref:Uncharacterized protein n=1 Tax=Ranatra chinensis TaxID=642074 RepID=A0ABD0Y3N7_9HEMI
MTLYFSFKRELARVCWFRVTPSSCVEIDVIYCHSAAAAGSSCPATAPGVAATPSRPHQLPRSTTSPGVQGTRPKSQQMSHPSYSQVASRNARVSIKPSGVPQTTTPHPVPQIPTAPIPFAEVLASFFNEFRSLAEGLVTAIQSIVLLWNCNGLNPHRNELDIFLHDQRIDVALLTETHFTNRSHCHITDYVTYRTDHPDCTAHGGTAILVRQQLSHHVGPSIALEPLQSTAVQLHTFPFPITLAAVYCPPNKNLTLGHLTSLFQSLGPRFISGGDYNCKHPLWGCRVATPSGRLLHRVITDNNFGFVSPNSPTYWPSHPNRLPDLLDFFVSSGLHSIYSTAQALSEPSSDYSPVLLTISLDPVIIPRPPNLTPGLTDWDYFRHSLDSNINLSTPLKTPTDLDDAVHRFTQHIQQSAWLSSQSQTRPPRLQYYNLPQHIRQLITAKRRARSRWQRSRYPSDRQHYDSIANELRNVLSCHRSASYDNYVSSLSEHDKSLWRATKRLLHYPNVSSPLRWADNSWARSDEEKAETFASHLRLMFQPLPDSDPVNTSRVLEFLDSPLPLSLPPPPFTPSDVSFQISRLPTQKSPGYDLITSQQCFRVTDQISFALEKKEYCGGVFLDVAQAFDRVWHPGLLFKLKRILPSTYYLILQSYLTNRYSVVCHGEKLSGYIQIKASVPQGSVLGPLLYLVYTADIPTQTSTSMATFADDIWRVLWQERLRLRMIKGRERPYFVNRDFASHPGTQITSITLLSTRSKTEPQPESTP